MRPNATSEEVKLTQGCVQPLDPTIEGVNDAMYFAYACNL
jgi:hypothetical protein